MMFFGLKKDKDINLQDVKLLYTKGNYKAALSKCKQYLEKHKNDFDATNLLGDIYYHLGDKTKALEIYKELAELMEEDKYLDKSIALTKKIIRLFPDQYDLYRRLSKLFAKKNLKAEQLNVLYELSELYEKNNLSDKSIEIFKEIAEIDRENIESYKKIVKKLYDFGKKSDVCKFMYYCLELSYNKNDLDSLSYFCNIALECNCDLKDSIKFTVNFFNNHPEHKEVFIKYAKEYLTEDFDGKVFSLLVKYLPYEKETAFYSSLKDKYKKYEIYSFLLSNCDPESEKFKSLINEINNLPDYEFDPNLTKLCSEFYEKVNDPETLDLLIILASKGDLKDTQIAIYEKLAQIYKDQNEIDKAESIEKYINELKYSDFAETYETDKVDESKDIESSFEAEDLELDIHTYEEIDLGSFDTSFQKDELSEDELSVIKLENHFDLDIAKEVNEEVNKEDKGSDFDIEIDLGDLETIEKDEAKEREEISVENKIHEIETLMASNNLSEARNKLDEVLLKYPDHEKLKDIATSLIFLESGFSDNEEEIETKNIIKDIKSDFLKIAESIKKSIDEQISEDDYETHFGLANAYMEMELYEDAIFELKKSATGNKKYESLYLLGECYKRLGEYDNAINVHKLIVVEYEEKEKILNSLYEIGNLLELKGDKDLAQDYFEKVYNIDPEFRDIKDKYNYRKKSEKSVSISESSTKNEDLLKDESSTDKKKKKISFL
jgi:tetratricopeptide (TPR) repeat protein